MIGTENEEGCWRSNSGMRPDLLGLAAEQGLDHLLQESSQGPGLLPRSGEFGTLVIIIAGAKSIRCWFLRLLVLFLQGS